MARQTISGDGSDLLAEAVETGFRQPDFLAEVEEVFAGQPQWGALSAAMAAPARPPEVEVTEWPVVTYGPELMLDRLPSGRELELRYRLPAPRASAWETTQELLQWATTRWEHANDHVDSEDALEVLDRVAAGERFACVEYSIVLSQALNAVGIPARRSSLRMRDYHVGFGRAHVVSEAWVDDLGRWVLLDGQNGAWWGSTERPLGLRELQLLARDGGERPAMVLTAREMSDEDQAHWWRYFYSVTSSGLGWDDTVVPLFQGQPSKLRVAVRPNMHTHPDLAQLETGTVDTGDAPALAFRPAHPFATGVRVGETDLAVEAAYDLDQLPPGHQQLEVRTRTPYGLLAPQSLGVHVRR